MRYNKERVATLLAAEQTKEVVNELIELNYGLIHNQLKKFGLLTDQDAISFGYEALYNAIVTFDRSKKTCFSTYATVCIYNRLGSHLRAMKNIESVLPMVTDNSVLEIMKSPYTADGEVLSECGINNIIHILITCRNELTNSIKKQIITVWMRSGFRMSHERVAYEVGCTQSYVSQVIKAFKYKLEVRLNEL